MEHGPWIWKILLIGGSLFIVSSILTLRYLIGKRSVQRRLHAARGRSVVRGRLGGDSQQVLVASAELQAHPYLVPQPTPATISTSERASKVWIDTDQGRVEIPGEIVVLLGSTAECSYAGTPPSMSATHLASARAAAPWVHTFGEKNERTTGDAVLRTLRAGDEVIAIGTIEAAASAEDGAGYRDNAITSLLRGAGEHPVELAACRPAREQSRLNRFGIGMLAALCLGAGYMTLTRLGNDWLEECGKYGTDKPNPAPSITNTHACVLAAATPTLNHQAQELLLRRLDWSESTPETRAVQEALSLRLEDCSARTSRLQKASRHDDLIVHARACKDPDTEHEELLLQARFDEAARVSALATETRPTEVSDVKTLVLAGRWSEAADRLSHQRLEGDLTPEQKAAWQLYNDCVTQLLRHYSGSADALGKLRELRASPLGDLCVEALAEAVPVAERASVLDSPRERLSRNAELLAWASGLRRMYLSLASPEAVLTTAGDVFDTNGDVVRAWLVDLHRDELLAQSPSDPEALRWLAAARAFDGDFDEALKLADRVIPMRPQRYPAEADEYPSEVRFLRAAIKLHTADVREQVDLGVPDEFASVVDIWKRQFGRLLLRANQPIAARDFSGREEYAKVLATAAAGDGGPLAEYLHSKYSIWAYGDILAVLPHVTKHRDALIDELRDPPQNLLRDPSLYDYPFHLAASNAMQRDLFRLAGLTEQAAAADATYRRIDAALADRRKLVALLLLGE